MIQIEVAIAKHLLFKKDVKTSMFNIVGASYFTRCNFGQVKFPNLSNARIIRFRGHSRQHRRDKFRLLKFRMFYLNGGPFCISKPDLLDFSGGEFLDCRASGVQMLESCNLFSESRSLHIELLCY